MKKIIIIAVGISIFILLLFAITFLESLKGGNIEVDPGAIKPTLVTSQRSARPQPISYEKRYANKLLEIAQQRPTPIVPRDATIRTQIIAGLNGRSGVIHSTPDFQLEYYKSPNSFEAKIKTTNTKVARNEVVEYLKSLGLTNDGICKLPLLYYLDVKTSEFVVKNGVVFNPIPEFCL